MSEEGQVPQEGADEQTKKSGISPRAYLIAALSILVIAIILIIFTALVLAAGVFTGAALLAVLASPVFIGISIAAVIIGLVVGGVFIAVYVNQVVAFK